MRRFLRFEPYLILACLFLVFGCKSKNENASSENLSTLEEMHYSQYIVYGRQLYVTHCSNCHQEDGSGLGRLIPPLAKSDYMLENISRTVCLIKYGLQGSIIVNEEEYHQEMPANEKLTALEIAQITTYIMNSWGNEKGYISVKDAIDYLEECN